MSAISISPVPWEKASMALLLEADPHPEKVMGYLRGSLCLELKKSGKPIGICVILDLGKGLFELMNIAVLPSFQKQGYGRKLLGEAIRIVKTKKARRLEVGTGSFGYQLAFYQREGFRVFKVERDFFLDHYPEAIHEQGIQLKDMLRLALDFG